MFKQYGRWLLAWCVALPICVAYLATWAVLGAIAGPAPRPKPAKAQPSILGQWKMTWGGSEWHVWFTKDGVYECGSQRGVAEWVGTWKFHDGKLPPGCRALVVEERHVADGHVIKWTAVLEDGKLQGRLNTCGEFRLEAPKPDL